LESESQIKTSEKKIQTEDNDLLDVTSIEQKSSQVKDDFCAYLV
jgi:hypothetical protein